MRWVALLLATVSVSVLVVLVGCGSGSSPGPGGTVATVGKFMEYTGDGGGSLKPWPGLFATAGDQANRVPTELTSTAVPTAARVPAGNINWFYVDHWTTLYPAVITVQPTADEDSDLYVMEGQGSAYGDGAGCLGFSKRTPDGTQPDRLRGLGYAPDWVAYDLGSIPTAPAAQVAVYGATGGTAKKHFTIEIHSAFRLSVGGLSSSTRRDVGSSAWYRFYAFTGRDYSLQLTATDGDPDMYLYALNSSGYVARHTAVGGGTINFTAKATGYHYVRVHAYSSATSGVSSTIEVDEV
jgi:hypothetical protein